jgi:CubicO group peptidase (beta-lactamase class C family)
VQYTVRRNGEAVCSGASGVADIDTGAPLTERHLFRIASHSKTLAAVLVLQLAEQGRLRLDDPLELHVPDLTGSPIADRTVRDLLTHSGGVIRDGEDGDFWQSFRPFPDRAQLITVARNASAATLARNEHFKYSNIGYGLLGLVLDSVTGGTFRQAVQEMIAERLALADLGGEYDPSRAADYAAGHSGYGDSRDRRVIEHIDTGALAAATGAYATARDLTAFFSALLPGATDLLNADSLRLQQHWHWEIKAGERRYGMGMFLDHIAESDLFGHTGGYPGHITATFADGEDGSVVSVLTNCIDGGASQLASAFFRLRDLGKKADHAVADDAAARFTGRYHNLWGLLDVVRIDSRLFAVSPTEANPAEDAVELEVVDDTSLRIAGGRGGNSYGELMRFQFDPDGAVVSMRADSGMTMTPLPAAG